MVLENKKIKDEYEVLEESDYKQDPQEIEELNIDDLNNEVTTVISVYKDNLGKIWPKPTLLDFGPTLYKDNLGKIIVNRSG